MRCLFLRLLFIASVCIQHIYVYFGMNMYMRIQHMYPAVISSIVVVSALIHCTLLHSMSDLKAPQMNVQCILIHT